MQDLQTPSGVHTPSNPRGSSPAPRQILDVMRDSVAFTQGILVSVLPNGRLQIVQPIRCPESLLRAYTCECQVEDRLAWKAILSGAPVRPSDCWNGSDFEAGRFFQQFMAPNGLRHAAAVSVASPILAGYPGAVLLFRGTGEADFTADDLANMKKVGAQFDSRPPASGAISIDGVADPAVLSHPASSRVFFVGVNDQVIYPATGLNLDDSLTTQIHDYARRAIEHARAGQPDSQDHLSLPNSRSDLWIFHVTTYEQYPAMSDSPVVFFGLQPESYEWVNIRPVDVQADPELVRLLPSLQYMQQEFQHNPTLDEIARRAHLSPFHFHRRFTDVIGQTPKHFLLACQIHEAKRLLVTHKRELAQIASDCGFAHQSHFTSRFKQATGLTPTRWRRLAAQLSQQASEN